MMTPAQLFDLSGRVAVVSGAASGMGKAMASALADFPGPVITGFPSGHTVGPQQTLPLGVRARVIAEPSRARLIIEEPAVQ